jgi:hypothetical protein
LLELTRSGKIDPSFVITHRGRLDNALAVPDIPGQAGRVHQRRPAARMSQR